MLSPLRALGAAIIAAGLVLSSTLLWAHTVRSSATQVSHQQPTPDPWFETVTTHSADEVAHGKTVFLNSCAHCHGADARGDEGPDLHDLQVSDRYIARTVTNGIKGEMPSFGKKLGPADVSALTAFIRTLE
jgi:mono/diheme cytochrome c family protein